MLLPVPHRYLEPSSPDRLFGRLFLCGGSDPVTLALSKSGQLHAWNRKGTSKVLNPLRAYFRAG